MLFGPIADLGLALEVNRRILIRRGPIKATSGVSGEIFGQVGRWIKGVVSPFPRLSTMHVEMPGANTQVMSRVPRYRFPASAPSAPSFARSYRFRLQLVLITVARVGKMRCFRSGCSFRRTTPTGVLLQSMLRMSSGRPTHGSIVLCLSSSVAGI